MRLRGLFVTSSPVFKNRSLFWFLQRSCFLRQRQFICTNQSGEIMKKLLKLVLAAAALIAAFSASAQNLTEAQARAVIAPWYSMFNQPVQGDVQALHEQVLTADYQSC